MAAEKYLSDKMIKELGFEPTECQKKLFNTLGEFAIATPEKWITIISGYAGTGKTTAIAAFIKVLKISRQKYILLAPTGRSAKVLANYTGETAKTIHKQIYRQKTLKEGVGQFTIDVNKNKNTFFIVDEASLLTNGYQTGGSIFGSGDVLDDLITYIKSNDNNRLIIMGDPAQLPPIGMDKSPALDANYISMYSTPLTSLLTTVVRQNKESGILINATSLRKEIENNDASTPHFQTNGYDDIERITGGDLIEALGDAFDKYGIDETVVLCRSNKRANRYNTGIRQSILNREEQLTKGDKVMIVKNCYQFLENTNMDFIANGDVAELIKISKFEERYGLHYANAVLSFPDYNNVEVSAKIILDTLQSTTPSLGTEEQNSLYEQVMADYSQIKNKRKRFAAVREDIYFNALQIKYASAITCHKSQGGQWRCVFIDNCFWNDEITIDDKKWLYTALTRAVEKVYLINFKDNFFI